MYHTLVLSQMHVIPAHIVYYPVMKVGTTKLTWHLSPPKQVPRARTAYLLKPHTCQLSLRAGCFRNPCSVYNSRGPEIISNLGARVIICSVKILVLIGIQRILRLYH